MSLLTPDDFADDQYGWLTNQISHAALGVFLVFSLCTTHYVVAGEFPHKTHVFLLIFAAYVLFEVLVQGWRGSDTVEDTVFVVGYGASGVLASFTELEVGSSVVLVDVLTIGIFFAFAMAHLFTGLRYRLIDS